MKIEIQELTAYNNSLKWEIQRNYYLKRGVNAWKKSEVPFNITSNPQSAYQNARVVFDSLIQNYDSDEKIYILEIGSGTGVFALNFIEQFESICKKENSDFYKKIHYLFTDFSPKNLQDASNNPYLAKLKKDGLLDFYILDALNPKGICNLDGTNLDCNKIKFSAVIANYVYCTLPVHIIKKDDDKFYEKNIKLIYQSKKYISNKKELIEKIVNEPIGIKVLKNIKEIEQFKEIDLDELIEDEFEIETLLDVTKNIDLATLVFPFGTFKSLREFESLIKKDGIILISDKAHIDESFMYNEGATIPSIHGNSFAHSLNIPLIRQYAKKLSMASLQTSNPYNSLQTILISKSDVINRNIIMSFKDNFVDNNHNEDASDFIEVAGHYKDAKDYDSAIKFYLKALKYRPKEASIIYYLGQCYYDNGFYLNALELCLNKAPDILEHYDFDFELGKIMYSLRKFSDAINYYNESILKFGENSYTYYNIALCWQLLKSYKNAYKYFFKAFYMDKKYTQALIAIIKLPFSFVLENLNFSIKNIKNLLLNR